MEEKNDIKNIRHTLAHLLAAAVLKHYPDAKPTIGPAIDNGFYYDFDFASPISSDDLPRIEQTMRELLKTWGSVAEREVSMAEALAQFAHNEYKQELLREIQERGERITLYTWGEFDDLCRGGHAEDASSIDSQGFTLTHLAGAYWRGSEKNPMLTRIYGAAFASSTELHHYLEMLEEAKKRDHRKIGHEQELFFIDETIGKGLAMWLPNGTIIRDQIEACAVEKERKAGYVRVVTPHMAKEELYLRSGHLPYYKESMYPRMDMDDGVYYLKAMNCPHHHTLYNHKPHSYRELPIRYAEYGTVYRNELSGTLAGLLRVRGMAMNDAHIYCRKDQIQKECTAVLSMIIEYFKIFGLADYWFRLSKWSPDHTEKYIDEPDNWEYSQNVMRDVLIGMGVPYTEVDDEAAFYGPKVDVQFKSVIGREETMSTVQLDFAAKGRFGLSYIDETGAENNDVFVIHRAPLSTHERFIAFLIEHTGGVWPLWLAPVQISILPVGETHHEASRTLANQLEEQGIRTTVDDSNDTVGKKIRNAEHSKIPYMLVIGDKEKDLQTLSVRVRGLKETAELSLDTFKQLVLEKIATRSQELT